EPLAPDLFTPEDPREVPGPLLLGGLGDQRRSRVEQADEVHTHVGGAGERALLEEDQVLAGGCAAAAVRCGPVDARVAGVEERTLPSGVVRAPGGPIIGSRVRWKGGDRLPEPRAERRAELPLGLSVVQ